MGSMTDTLPILYSFRRCPYAMRARMALRVSGIQYEHREILLRNKPESMLNASPKGTVPVFVLRDGRVLDQSLDIMLWALEAKDPEDWLAPELGKTKDILTFIQNETEHEKGFKGHLDRYKYSARYVGDVEKVDIAKHKRAGIQFLSGLNERLGEQKELFGGHISLGDIALFPFIRQFANADRACFDQLPLPHLHRWLSAHLGSDLFGSIMVKRPLWSPTDIPEP